ncbi:hypothetical protein [Microbacterium lacusdiani]
MTRMIRLAAVVAIVSSALALAGCMAEPRGPFSAPPTGDVLPEVVDTAGLLPDSVRHLGEDADGNQYYAAESEDRTAPDCLIIYISDEEWVRACSSLPVKAGIAGLSATLHYAALTDVPEDKRVGDFVELG